MSGVFQNIDPQPPPSSPGECVLTAFGAGGGHTRWVERGGDGGVNILVDVRHNSVLYVCKYFVHGADQRERRAAMLRGANDYFCLF
jgi:hypothetical protein